MAYLNIHVSIRVGSCRMVLSPPSATLTCRVAAPSLSMYNMCMPCSELACTGGRGRAKGRYIIPWHSLTDSHALAAFVTALH
jgi:hypothetical protein